MTKSGVPPGDANRVSTSSKDGAVANAIIVVVVVVALIWSGIQIWNQDEIRGLIFHDKLTGVSSEGWEVGEYKDCMSLNINTDEPALMCDDQLASGKAKVFRVRFYGKTYVKGRPKDKAFDWKCRKNNDADPAITCDKR